MSSRLVTDGIRPLLPPAIYRDWGSGDSSGMIFGFRASSGRTDPGFSGHARQTYSFRLRLFDLGLTGNMYYVQEARKM
jgi:hypothetical protein